MAGDGSTDFDSRELRDALGTFATGVTVVTARAAGGAPVGLAVNSFSSVSLEPPLILWSIANGASLWEVFRDTDRFAVHVLGAHQEAVSNQFAGKAPDRFAGINTTPGLGDVPLLVDCVARFECRTENQYAGGDHTILVGLVERLWHVPGTPLIFFGGRYAQLAAAPAD